METNFIACFVAASVVWLYWGGKGFSLLPRLCMEVDSLLCGKKDLRLFFSVNEQTKPLFWEKKALVYHLVSLILHSVCSYNSHIPKGKVQGYMVRRGMLLVLAGIFWLAGAAGMYQRMENFALFSANDLQNSSNPLRLGDPFRIPGTDLVALEIISYDGLYLEDGSKEGVSNVAGLILRNDGAQFLEYALVELWQGQRELSFEVYCLPAGEKILVLESSRKQYEDQEISNCIGYALLGSEGITGLVSVRSIEERMLMVSNPGPLPLKDVTVYFKSYDYEKAMFLGGITYEVSISRLAPRATFFTRPMYYSAEYSRIVKIKTSG